MRNLAVINLLITSFLLLISCDIRNYDKEVSQQYPSPDNSSIASLVKYNYGATVPYVYRVFIHSKNANPLTLDQELDVLRTDSNKDIKITWHNNKSLSIKCIKGSVYKYTSIGEIDNQRLRINLNTNC